MAGADRSGNVVVVPQFDRVSRFSEGLATIEITEENITEELIEVTTKCGYIDETGQMVIEPQFQDAGSFCEGLAYVLDGFYGLHGLYGYINSSGEMVINPQFYDAGCFSEGLAPVCLQCYPDKYTDSWGYIDREGKMVLKPQFHYAKSFSEGLAAVCVEQVEYDDEWIDVWSYIDTTGQVVLGPKLGKYSYARKRKGYTEQVVDSYIRDADAFSEGLAAVELRVGNKWGYDGRNIWRNWGYIDKKGDLVIDPIYSVAGKFVDGLALVSLSDTGGATYIDGSGNIVWTDTMVAEDLSDTQ